MSTNASLNDPQIHACLMLQRVSGVGSGRYWKLLEHFNTPLDLLRQPLSSLRALVSEDALTLIADYQQRTSASELGQALARDLDWLNSQTDIHLLTPNCLDYPRLLHEIPRPPALLYVRGNPTCLSLPQLAIVGSRTPTPAGSDNAFQFARHLADRGFAITSGLALGIDGAAHAGALAAHGKTLAVFGTGIDSVYPARHRPLAQQILAEGGALVSEFPLGTRSQAGNFPQRNRLISGMSCGTLVVEAAVQSGSLITARLAMQQNREVFAIPGSIHNPLARGCHSLIRQGACLVEKVEDILEQLGGILAFKQEELVDLKSHPQDLDESEIRLIQYLGFDPTPFDQLAARLDLTAGSLAAQLMNLELKGVICNTPQGYMRLKA